MTLSISQLESYPCLLRVKDIQVLINIGRDAAYRLVHTPGFPKMEMHGIMLVHPVALKKWLERNQTTTLD